MILLLIYVLSTRLSGDLNDSCLRDSKVVFILQQTRFFFLNLMFTHGQIRHRSHILDDERGQIPSVVTN